MTREAIDGLGRDPAAVQRWLDQVAAGQRLEEDGACLIRGHPGTGAVALDKMSGIYKYRCDCGKRTWWWLAELRASWMVLVGVDDGKRPAVERLRQGERLIWTRRLFDEAGIPMALPREESIAIPPAPEGSPPHVVAVRDGFVRLVRLKAIGFAGQSALYRVEFVARWNGVTVDEARDAIGLLRAAAVLERVTPRGKPYLVTGLPKDWRP